MFSSHLKTLLVMIMIAIAQSLQNCGRMGTHKRIRISPSIKLQQKNLIASSSSSVISRMSEDRGNCGPVEVGIYCYRFFLYLSEFINDDIFSVNLNFHFNSKVTMLKKKS
jgi:hypothetical protein